MKLDCGYGLDLIVEEGVILEIKAVEHLAPIHHEQLLSYLRFFREEGGLDSQFPRARAEQLVKENREWISLLGVLGDRGGE